MRKVATDMPAAKGEAILKQLDESGVIFMVEGFPGFGTGRYASPCWPSSCIMALRLYFLPTP